MSLDLFPPPALGREAFASPRLAVVPIKGDAMAPTLRGDWDYVLAAPVKSFLYDSLYVVDFAGVPTVFRAQGRGPLMISLIRDNERYGSTPAARSDDVPREWFNEHVLGIVVCDLKVRDPDLMRKAWGGPA